MIYRIFSSLLVAAVIFIAGSISGPAPGNAFAGDNPSVAASSNNAFEGLLVVKEADGVFLIRAENGDKKRFTINPNAIITRNGKPAAYSDLRSRDRIRVHYTSDFVITKIEASGS